MWSCSARFAARFKGPLNLYVRSNAEAIPPASRFCRPLLDHFHPPLHPLHHGESFHSNWATRIADDLNENWLPREFLAEESTHAGTRVEIDVATFERQGEDAEDAQPLATTATATMSPATTSPTTWAPPAAAQSMPAVLPDTFEVQVFSTTSGLKLVGAIELVSPGNKDRGQQCLAFATKCASLLYQGVSVVIVDIVTNRRANLHDEILSLMEADPAFKLPEEANLYAVAYRPVVRNEQPEVDLWKETFEVGDALPTLPLRLTGDLFVPIDLERTYTESCRRRRLL